MDHAGGHSEPITMDGLPLASRPKHVPIWALITARSEALGLPPFLLLFLFFFGQALLEFPPQGAGEVKVVHASEGVIGNPYAQ
jgi:hypothetical protein